MPLSKSNDDDLVLSDAERELILTRRQSAKPSSDTTEDPRISLGLKLRNMTAADIAKLPRKQRTEYLQAMASLATDGSIQ
jgi:hypothetical protein